MTRAHAFLTAERLLRDGVGARVYPAACAEVGTSAGVVWRAAVGALTYEADAPAASADTIFDLASLTKVVATTAMAMVLADRGVLDVGALVTRHVPSWNSPDRRHVQIRDLLEHASGLPAWTPIHRTCADADAALAAIVDTPLDYAPRTRSAYSDLGFILLGFILTALAGRPLDAQFDDLARALQAPDGGTPLTFTPPATWRGRIAPTRIDEIRERLLVGEVDDANAWALGGVAGHAGLFGTAGAVGAFARRILHDLAPADAGATRIWRAETLHAWFTRSNVPGSSRAMGWDTMLPASSCGTRMSASAVGHTGFTGTSLWLDRDRGIYAVLLTNRVYPVAQPNDGMQTVRRAFHDAVVEAMTP